MNFVPFAISTAAVTATATLGSQYTQQSVQSPWYSCVKPSFAPPSWVFPVVWTLLYISLAAAMGLSILRDSSLLAILHSLNLILNVVWCWMFFGKRNLKGGLGVIVGNLGVAMASLTLYSLASFCYKFECSCIAKKSIML
jgi:tryptophan-rich sensory protein